MKRSSALLLIALALLLPMLYGAYMTKLGDRDIEWGSGTWVDSDGRTRYRVNADIIPFSTDNSIKVGNTNLYSLSSGVIGNWKVIYTNGSGTISVVALDNNGLCLKSNGPAAAPSWGLCGDSGSYDPANVAITGGTIIGPTTLGSLGYPVAIEYATVTEGISVTPDGGIYFYPKTTYGSPWYLLGDTQYSDNVFAISTNATGSTTDDNVALVDIVVNYYQGTLETSQKVFTIRDRAGLDLLKLYGSGNAEIAAAMNAGGGYASSVADGYRRMNICNTSADIGDILFEPAKGDITCMDNVLYIYSGTEWLGYAAGTGGEPSTPPTFSVSDDFNRTDADPEGLYWEKSTGSRDPKISSNTLMMGAGGTGTNMIAYWDNSATFANNQYSQMKINTLGQGGPMVRVQSDEESGYLASPSSTTTLEIYRVDSGSHIQLGAACSGTFAASDTFKIAASGSTITAYQNDTAITDCSRTDSTYTGGNPGIDLFGTDGAADDWAGGDL